MKSEASVRAAASSDTQPLTTRWQTVQPNSLSTKAMALPCSAAATSKLTATPLPSATRIASSPSGREPETKAARRWLAIAFSGSVVLGTGVRATWMLGRTVGSRLTHSTHACIAASICASTGATTPIRTSEPSASHELRNAAAAGPSASSVRLTADTSAAMQGMQVGWTCPSLSTSSRSEPRAHEGGSTRRSACARSGGKMMRSVQGPAAEQSH
eukprot:3516664-Rhodomonas_salina.1